MRMLPLSLLGIVTACGGTAPVSQQGDAGNEVATLRIVPGIYGDVTMSGETGDLGGFEVNLDESLTRADVVHCEGWCNSVNVATARPDGAALILTYSETSVAGDGAPATTRSTALRLTPNGQSIMLSVDWGNGFQQRILPKLAQEFGLAEARRQDAEGPRINPPLP
jgi:hypothetical protein